MRYSALFVSLLLLTISAGAESPAGEGGICQPTSQAKDLVDDVEWPSCATADTDCLHDLVGCEKAAEAVKCSRRGRLFLGRPVLGSLRGTYRLSMTLSTLT